MDIFLMYILMITDLTWTLMHHEEVGELNPLFARMLSDNEVTFVYMKLAANSIAAFIVIFLRRQHRILSHVLAALGIIVYGFVVWMHWFVYQCLLSAERAENSALWGYMTGG